MDKSEQIICDQCAAILHGSSEVQSPIKHCPRCEEKRQQEMLTIMFGLDSKTNEENMSYSSVCEPIDLYALIDTQLDKVVILIQAAHEDASYRHNGKWITLFEEDGKDLDGLMVIHVDPTFIAVYDEVEGSGEAIKMIALKKYELRKIDD